MVEGRGRDRRRARSAAYRAHQRRRLRMVAALVVVAAVVVVTGGSPVAIVYAFNRVWVADSERRQVMVIDPASRQVTDSIAVPAGAVRLSVAATALWIANADNTVTRLDPQTKQPGAPVRVG